MANKNLLRPIGLLVLLTCLPATSSADNNSSLQDYPLEVCSTDPTQSGSAAAVTNSNIVQGDNTLFASYYNYANLSGDLKAFTIDPTTGTVSSTPQWTNSGTPVGAQGKLDAIASNQLNNSRNIYSNVSGSVTLSSSGSFCNDSSNQTYLGAASNTACQDIIDSLKGVAVSGYRTQTHRLGTIVHSEPVYVSGLARVIQAANDGMVHAFKHDSANNSSNGEEAWAYVPKAFLNSIGQPDAPNKINAYIATGYAHQYWLDATPAIETLSSTYYFASGYGKGAKGVFSLTLAADSPTPLWTLDNSSNATTVDSDVGYLYGRPIITQVTIGTTVTKVAIFAGGFSTFDLSNLSTSSHLYVVNLSTGALIKKFTLPGSIDGTARGLNYIAGYADSYSSLNQVQYVYGGDLDGNVWRFDLTATTAGSWTVHKLASLSAPITSEPELAAINIGGVAKRIVYVGTGRYLTPFDISSGETGSMYGLIDRIDSVANYNDSTDATQTSQLSTVTLSSSNFSTIANTGTASYLSTHGWKAQLPTGQRIINSPALANGVVLFTANKPADACTVGNSGMESWLYAVNYQTGLQSAYYSLATLSNGNDSNANDKNFLASRPTVIKLGSGQFKAMIRTTDGETIKVDIGSLLGGSSGTGTARGVSWREVITQ